MTGEQFQKFRKGQGVIQLSFEELDEIIVNACNYDCDDYINNHLSGDLIETKIIGLETVNQREFINIDTSQNLTMPGK